VLQVPHQEGLRIVRIVVLCSQERERVCVNFTY
jgi:hypothetical protein